MNRGDEQRPEGGNRKSKIVNQKLIHGFINNSSSGRE